MINEDIKVLDIVIPKSVTENSNLPDPEILEYYKNYENRIIYVDDDITDLTFEVTKQIYDYNRADKGKAVEERKPIIMFVYSYGGDLNQCYALISAIRASQTPIITINSGVAMSAGALIFLAGHKRLTMKYSKVMFHPGSSVQEGTYEQMQESQKNYKRTVDMMSKYIIERTNITQKKLSANWTKDWYIDANEQIELGIADKIIDNLDEVYSCD